MIDFRYHLVSIVSIFLALAVGIALGAGPLKGTLSDTINSELASLRADKTKLNSQLDTANKAADQRDSFIAASNKQLLAGRLSGSTIALVVLPGVDGSLVKSTTSTLTAAGAKLGVTVTVKPAWADPATRTTRDALGARLVSELHLDPKADAQLFPADRALAAALQHESSDTITDAMTAGVLKQLSDAKLLSTDRDTIIPGTAAVVLSAPVDTGNADTDTTEAQAFAGLATALDRAGRGTVLASASGVSPDKGVSVVATARSQGTATRGLSTVDDASIPMGQASVVLALLEQFQGGAGQYGLGSDATAVFPALQGS